MDLKKLTMFKNGRANLQAAIGYVADRKGTLRKAPFL